MAEENNGAEVAPEAAPDAVLEGKRFIGPRAVAMVAEEAEIKTPAGADVVTIHYEGGFTEMMPKLSFEFLVLDQPTDWNDLRRRKLHEMQEAILAVVAERDFKAGEVDALKIGLENSLLNSFNRATHFLWTKDDPSFVPGYNVVLDRSLLETELVLRTIPKVAENGDTAGKTEETPAA